MTTVVLVLGVITILSSASAMHRFADHVAYVQEDSCNDNVKHHYIYTAEEEYFEPEKTQTSAVKCGVHLMCVSVGSYGERRAVRFRLDISDLEFGGEVMKDKEYPREEFNDRMNAKPFEFVQTDDGQIHATYHSREDDAIAVNFKKSITTSFQGNFEGTPSRIETDTGSIHKSEYQYYTSIQDMENGKIVMERKTTSKDVISFAQHIPTDEVNMTKCERSTFQHGILDESSRTIDCRLMPKTALTDYDTVEDDMEEDNLESVELREKRQSEYNDPISYDPSIVTNKYDSKGSFSIRKIGTTRLRRRQVRELRSDPDLVQSTLLGFINETQRSLERMADLQSEIGGIEKAMMKLEKQPNNTGLAQKIETILKLEFQYGPPSDLTPSIDIVLQYLHKHLGSNDPDDIKMRITLYFLISSEGSLCSQMALLNALEKAKDDEELESVHIYIALVANPQPQFVAKLETFISSDVHSNDPLLLIYGAIIPRASVKLQGRMELFLINRLDEAEKISSSLVHYILSLGNSASNKSIEPLIGYLHNPDTDVQLVSIFAMRFLMNNPLIQKTLKRLITQPNVTEDHVTMVAKALMYGAERAKLNRQPKPYSQNLAETLVLIAAGTQNEELTTAFSSLLKGGKQP